MLKPANLPVCLVMYNSLKRVKISPVSRREGGSKKVGKQGSLERHTYENILSSFQEKLEQIIERY